VGEAGKNAILGQYLASLCAGLLLSTVQRPSVVHTAATHCGKLVAFTAASSCLRKRADEVFMTVKKCNFFYSKISEQQVEVTGNKICAPGIVLVELTIQTYTKLHTVSVTAEFVVSPIASLPLTNCIGEHCRCFVQQPVHVKSLVDNSLCTEQQHAEVPVFIHDIKKQLRI